MDQLRRLSNRSNAQICVICLNKVTRFDRWLKCKHLFHQKCITTWFETSIECPVCRMELDDDPLIIFRKNVENNLKEKQEEVVQNYKEAIRTLELENTMLRRRLAVQHFL